MGTLRRTCTCATAPRRGPLPKLLWADLLLLRINRPIIIARCGHKNCVYTWLIWFRTTLHSPPQNDVRHLWRYFILSRISVLPSPWTARGDKWPLTSEAGAVKPTSTPTHARPWPGDLSPMSPRFLRDITLIKINASVSLNQEGCTAALTTRIGDAYRLLLLVSRTSVASYHLIPINMISSCCDSAGWQLSH